jgi:ABC-type transporter Mla MlaB component
MLKIQRSIEANNVRFALSGRLEGQHLAELQRLIDEHAPHNVVTLDLEEIRLVDRDAVDFLARCEAAGVRLENCATYVREWIAREEETPANPPRTTRR